MTISRFSKTLTCAFYFQVQCKIMELENQGRGPHFVNAQRDDASVIRAQVTGEFLGFTKPLYSESGWGSLFLILAVLE